MFDNKQSQLAIILKLLGRRELGYIRDEQQWR